MRSWKLTRRALRIALGISLVVGAASEHRALVSRFLVVVSLPPTIFVFISGTPLTFVLVAGPLSLSPFLDVPSYACPFGAVPRVFISRTRIVNYDAIFIVPLGARTVFVFVFMLKLAGFRLGIVAMFNRTQAECIVIRQQ